MSIYMKIDGIKGDVTKNDGGDNYIGYSELQTYEFDANRNPHPSSDQSSHHSTSGRTSFSQFEITKYADSASPTILNYLHNQKLIPNIKIAVCHTNGKMLSYTLTNAKILLRQMTAASGAGVIECIKMSYESIREEFYPYNQQHQASAPTMAQINLVST